MKMKRMGSRTACMAVLGLLIACSPAGSDRIPLEELNVRMQLAAEALGKEDFETFRTAFHEPGKTAQTAWNQLRADLGEIAPGTPASDIVIAPRLFIASDDDRPLSVQTTLTHDLLEAPVHLSDLQSSFAGVTWHASWKADTVALKALDLTETVPPAVVAARILETLPPEEFQRLKPKGAPDPGKALKGFLDALEAEGTGIDAFAYRRYLSDLRNNEQGLPSMLWDYVELEEGSRGDILQLRGISNDEVRRSLGFVRLEVPDLRRLCTFVTVEADGPRLRLLELRFGLTRETAPDLCGRYTLGRITAAWRFIRVGDAWMVDELEFRAAQ